MLFDVKDLHVSFDTPDGPVEAVKGINLRRQTGARAARSALRGASCWGLNPLR